MAWNSTYHQTCLMISREGRGGATIHGSGNTPRHRLDRTWGIRKSDGAAERSPKAPVIGGSPHGNERRVGVAMMASGNHEFACRRMRPHAPLDLPSFFAGNGTGRADRMHRHRHRTGPVGDCPHQHDLIAAIQFRGDRLCFSHCRCSDIRCSDIRCSDVRCNNVAVNHGQDATDRRRSPG